MHKKTFQTPVADFAKLDPSRPMYLTRSEWLAHFKEIERGEFMTLDEYQTRFNEWKNSIIINRLK
jgi:hypothetical protein